MKINKYTIALWLVLLVLLFAVPSAANRGPHYGDAATAGQVQLSDGSGNWLTIQSGSLSADATVNLPAITTAIADTGVVYGDASSSLASDATNFSWLDTANSQALTLGAGTAAGTLELLEGSGGGTNTLGITAPATLAGDIEFIFPGTAIADKGILFASAASTLGHDATNFNWDDTANTNVLTLGAGTGGGTLALLEGSGGGTDTVSLTAPATLAAAIEYTLPNAFPTTAGNFWTTSTTGALTQRPAQRVLYSAYAASAAHTGDTAAETTIMPASADDPETVATDIGDANLESGNVLSYNVVVSATPDTPGDETLTVNVYFGSQLVGTSGAVAVDATLFIILDGTVKIRATGASGTGYYNARTASTQSGATTTLDSAAAFSSFDTTGTNAFAIKLDWGGTTAVADTSAVEDVTLYINAAD